ncbi:MAG TPA: GTPase Era [bacterium]|nr:GTPase Era [bacterium]HPN45543.1 GTPase Era [bacterium]
MDLEASNFKAGYVAIVGQPNVGKSTLTNELLKFRLSIITPKPQTTRHRILGILNGDNYQVIFLDTPGLIEPKYRLQEVMINAAVNATKDADLILFLVTAAAKAQEKDLAILEIIKKTNKPVILVINKIDIVSKSIALPCIDEYRQKHQFEAIIPISALKKENLDELEQAIIRVLPYGQPFYPPDLVTEHPERFFVSEIIREKIFQNYGEELPYSTAVVIDEFKEQEGRKDVIKARIVVERASQKGIIIGKGGAALKNVGQQARIEIEEFLGRPVFLELWVAVRDKWRKKDMFLKEFGYE